MHKRAVVGATARLVGSGRQHGGVRGMRRVVVNAAAGDEEEPTRREPAAGSIEDGASSTFDALAEMERDAVGRCKLDRPPLE